MKGWNGTLTVDGDLVTIQRGLRGALMTRGRARTKRFSVGEIKGVWFCPGRGRSAVGYVHIVTAGPQPPSNDYVACVRDPASVTFLGDPETWRALAERLSALSGAVLEHFAAPESADLVRRMRGDSRRDDTVVRF